MPNAIYCSVYGCMNNTKKQKDLSYFRFPHAKKRVQQWAERIGRMDIIGKLRPSTYRVCSTHFTPDMFINKRLNKFAIPTLNLNVPDDVGTSIEPLAPIAPKLPWYNTSTAISTPQTKDSTAPQPKVVGEEKSTKVNTQAQADPNMPVVHEVFSLQGTSGEQMRKRVAETNANDENDQNKKTKTDDSPQAPLLEGSKNPDKIIDNRNFIFETDHFVAKYFFWRSRLKEMYDGDKELLRVYALNFYLTNPQLYTFSLKTSILPSIKTIRKTKVQFRPEVNGDLITLLSKRLKNNRQNYKFCTLSIGEMSLRKNLYYDIGNDEIIGFQEINGRKEKELAKYAFVLQLRGCAVDYKQPLGYAFMGTQNPSSYGSMKEALKIWLLNTIRRLTEAGYKVVAVISEHTQILVDLADLFGVTVDNPYFDVDNERVYYIFDVPQILQDIYTNLSMYKILQDDVKLPIWDYIEAFYNRDQERAVKLAPKLTAAHFRPISSSKASYVKDVLSYAVAAGMSVDIEMGNLPAKATHVVNFILKFSNFLEILNSKIGTLSSAKNNQECLRDFLEYLQNVNIFKVVDDDSTDIMELFKGMQVTLNSILLLHNFCLLEGIKYNLIIKNSVVNFIREIHKQSGISRELTPIQFRRAFSKLIMKSLFKNTPSNISIGEQDEILQFKSDLLFKTNIKFGPPNLSVQTTDYRMDLPEKNGFVYFCGYLVRKLSEKHFCSSFNHFKTYHEGYVRNNRLLKEFQAFSKGKKNGNLTVPSQRFVDFMKVYETIFLRALDETNMLEVGIGERLLKLYVSLYYTSPCSCFPTEYSIKLFLRMRLYLTIKYSNREINRDDENIPSYLVVYRLYNGNQDDEDIDDE